MLDIKKLQAKAQKAAEKMGLTPEEAKAFANAAHDVYDEVASDLEPDNKREGTCKRVVVIEVALDAGRVEQRIAGRYGSQQPAIFADNPERTKAIIEILHQTDYKTKIDLVGPMFPFERYEVGC